MATWTDETRRFLEARRVGHLATAGADGAPHVVPVCYALDDAAVYFVADLKPKRRPARVLARLENLRANPRAALVVDDYDDAWVHLAWVMVRGPAAVLTNASAHDAALALLRRRYPQYRTPALDDRDAHPIVRIFAARVTSWRVDGALRSS